MKDVPLNKRGRMYFQSDGALPHFSCELKISVTIVSLDGGLSVGVPTIGQPGLETYGYWIVMCGDG